MGAVPLAKPILPSAHIMSLWKKGNNTNEIARALGLRESVVANELARIRDLGRRQ